MKYTICFLLGLLFLSGCNQNTSTEKEKVTIVLQPFDAFPKAYIHELGHTQGLPHCPIKNCFMRDAEGKDVLNEETGFCKSCKTVLIRHGWNLK